MVVDSSIESDHARQLKVVKNHILRYQNYFLDKYLRYDDALMLKIAREYMERMGIRNTQYIIARHTDRRHAHCHIVFNRVNNDGKTISDKNDRYRNEKVCKMLTAKYRLHFAQGKDHVNEERLRPYDKARHRIYKALNAEVQNAQSWNELKDALTEYGIGMRFKVSRTTRDIQGVKFEYGKYTFSGPKIGREFSYLAIDRQLERNAYTPSYSYQETQQKLCCATVSCTRMGF